MIETNRIELKNIPRSNELMRVFRDVEMVEALGSGMNRIMRTYGRDNFEFGDNYIRMIVPYNWIPEDEIVDENGQKNVLENCVQIVDNDVSVGSCSEIKWPEKAPKIIVMIKENQYTTIADFEKELGIGHTTVKKILRELQENGFISRIGPDKGGKWQVIDKNIESLNS